MCVKIHSHFGSIWYPLLDNFLFLHHIREIKRVNSSCIILLLFLLFLSFFLSGQPKPSPTFCSDRSMDLDSNKDTPIKSWWKKVTHNSNNKPTSQKQGSLYCQLTQVNCMLIVQIRRSNLWCAIARQPQVRSGCYCLCRQWCAVCWIYTCDCGQMRFIPQGPRYVQLLLHCPVLLAGTKNLTLSLLVIRLIHWGCVSHEWQVCWI